MARPTRTSWLARGVASVLAGAALLLAGAPSAPAEDVAVTLDGLTAPVGLATDHARSRYWAVQATSGRLSVTAYGADGSVQGAAASRDTVTNVQALAHSNGHLYVGDVGGTREKVAVWDLMGPVPGADIFHADAIPLAYPDGARESAAIMVNASRRIFVVTKGKDPAIYSAPENPQVTNVAYPPAKPVLNKLTRVAAAPADVSDATFLLDGRAALRTPTAVVLLDGVSFARLGEQAVSDVQKGLSITQALDQQTVLSASSAGGKVVKIALPGGQPAKVVPVQATAAAPAPAAPQEAENPNAQTGTTIALVAAVVVALLAAAVVLVRR